MLVPHLHFKGTCKQAIAFYEKAFDTRAYMVYYAGDENGNLTDTVEHSEMKIHGSRIMLNDRFDTAAVNGHPQIQLVIVFETKEELLKSYRVINNNIIEITPLCEVDYSPLLTTIIDKFGIQWCFMVEDRPKD